jgi:molybdate transport system substrate-binding protein
MRCLIAFLTVFFLTANGFAADLMIFSGAGLIKPMEEMRRNFEKTHHIEADVHYGSSGEIFACIAAGQPADVFIPGAEKYTRDALKNGWVTKESIHKVVLHIPVIAVPKGNPANIRGLTDLGKPGTRVAIGDPKAPAIGRVAKKIFKKNGMTDKINPNIVVLVPTVNQLLIYVALKQVDAAIIWEDLTAWAEGKGKIEVIPIAKEQNIIKAVPTAVCTHAPHKNMALQFNEYISSDEGLKIWSKWGFEPCAK